MSSVSLPQMQQHFVQFDANKDGKLDRTEMAQASVNLLKQKDPEKQAAGALFAAFLQGGKDGQGLMPDLNNDRALDINELTQFAGLSGSKNAIDGGDFQTLFKDNAQVGNGVNLADLEKLAQGDNKFKLDSPASAPQGASDAAAASPEGEGKDKTLEQLLREILNVLIHGNENGKQA